MQRQVVFLHTKFIDVCAADLHLPIYKLETIFYFTYKEVPRSNVDSSLT